MQNMPNNPIKVEELINLKIVSEGLSQNNFCQNARSCIIIATYEPSEK